jgi:hypothetical protein
MILDAAPEKRIVVATDEPSTSAIYPLKRGEIEEAFTDPVGRPLVEAYVVDTFVDHHATCPAAAEWKGKRR